MAKLQTNDRRKTTRIELPSSTKEEPVWVDVYEEAISGDFEDVANVGEKRGSAIIQGVTNIIADWNFENSKGEKEKITVENVRHMSQPDLMFLVEKLESYDSVNGVTPEEKKSLVITSKPKSPESTPETPKT